ncbi:hypothetical protein B0J13DRAFT_2309 [Dactylonectria estremocensis]|uniref:Secreted protein n=1 Tax=Dactylonectria estremocensis TaxID=1079267 RepID=A0A9P9FI15_9HYPO|nr:hypothetical protein B0J13DRAFT_2309 [Dactylonectria estremocensis]
MREKDLWLVSWLRLLLLFWLPHLSVRALRRTSPLAGSGPHPGPQVGFHFIVQSAEGGRSPCRFLSSAGTADTEGVANITCNRMVRVGGRGSWPCHMYSFTSIRHALLGLDICLTAGRPCRTSY